MYYKFIRFVLIWQSAFLILLFLLQKTYYGELIISFIPLLIPIMLVGLIIGLYSLKINNNKYNTFLIGFNFTMILLFSMQIIGFYSFTPSLVSAANKDGLEVITVNVWWQNKDYSEMLTYFETKDADVLLLIEFTDVQYKELGEYLRHNYPYTSATDNAFDGPIAGNIVFSKYPIVYSADNYTDGYYSGYVETVIKYNEDAYTFMTIHTSAPTNSKYFALRNNQLDNVTNRIDKLDSTNLIVTGDLNLTPWSYYFKEFEAENSNSLRAFSGLAGIKFSWKSHSLPLVMAHIDHGFISNNININDFEISDFPGSDHDALEYTVSIYK